MPKKEKEEAPKHEVYLPFKIVGKKIFEAIYINGCPCWLGFDTENKKFSTYHNLDEIEVVYKPVTKDMIGYEPYSFDREFIEKLCKQEQLIIPDIKTIYSAIYKEFDIFLDIRNEFKHLETTFTFETYIQHKLNSTGYIYHTGEHDSGKSRPLQMQSHLAYRPLYGIKLNEANIYQTVGLEESLCTILEDEAQELDKKDNTGKLTVYRAGYEAGIRVPRIINGGESDRHQNYYFTFCCKGFSGYNFPRDRAFVSRCIESPFIEGKPQKDEVSKDDIARWEKLKSMLLIWRMVHYAKPLPEMDLTIRNRVKLIWKGKLAAIYEIPEVYEIISRMSQESQEQRTKDLHNSLEAHITKVVIYLERNYQWAYVPFVDIWDWLMISLNVPKQRAKDGSEVPYHQFNKFYVEMLGIEVTKNMVGRKFDSLHGKYTTKLHVGRMWQFKQEDLNNLLARYSITENDIKNLELE